MEVKDIATRANKEFKQTEVGVIPEDWKIKPLIDIVDFLDGKRKPIKDSDRTKRAGQYPYYGASGIIDYINDYIFDEQLILLGEDGENIVSRNARLAFQVDGKIWVNNHAHVLRPKQEYDICYITEKLESINYEKYNTGTAQPKLNQKVCQAILIPLPPTKAEQTAIATVLSDTDGLISHLETLIEKKRAIKQGAMHQLLKPKEGWVEKRLGDICFPSKNRIDPTSSPNYRCIELEHLSQESGRLLGTVDSNTLKSQKSTFTNGDVLFGKLRPYLKKYLHAEFDGVCTTEIWVLKALQGISSRWLFYLMQTDRVIEATNLSTGTKMPRAEWKTVSDTIIYLPSMNEQTRIAQILSDMDTEIAELEQKLAKYKLVKQGMMQELLTGKTRLV